MKTSKLLVLVLTLGLIMGLGRQYAGGDAISLLHHWPGTRQRTRGRISDNSQVIVNFNDRAYLWSLSGGLTDLGDLGGGKSYGYAINNLGQVVGESYINATTSHAFLWQSGQMMRPGRLERRSKEHRRFHQ